MAYSLLSVNVGQPRDVSWQGRTVRTAVWKRLRSTARVAGPARLRTSMATARATWLYHGGEQRAVFVYQIEAYRYWRSIS